MVAGPGGGPGRAGVRPPVDDAALPRLHADVLFRTDSSGRLTTVNEPGDEPAPRLYLVRGHAASILRLRLDVPARCAAACRDAASSIPPWDGVEDDGHAFDEVRAALASSGAIGDETRGPAFRFGDRVEVRVEAEIREIDEASAALLEPYFPYTQSVLGARSPVIGAIVGGRVVSACFAARRNDAACEAGVATEEPFRGRGLAPAVVAAWRDAVERAGLVPLYSTTWDNAASRAVARRLRLIAYASTLSLS